MFSIEPREEVDPIDKTPISPRDIYNAAAGSDWQDNPNASEGGRDALQTVMLLVFLVLIVTLALNIDKLAALLTR